MKTSAIESLQAPIALPFEWCLLPVASAATGLTVKAMEKKIEDGKWVEGREYVKRDGRIFVSVRGFNKWVANQNAQ
ncbi:MAG TPA: excisionase [Burkholderiaceae bacterium]|nr:excisionase [Burkholderiaceae bacterium]